MLLLGFVWNQNVQNYATILLQATTTPIDAAFVIEKLTPVGMLAIAVWFLNKLRVEEEAKRNKLREEEKLEASTRIAQLEKALEEERKAKFELLNGNLRANINVLSTNSQIMDHTGDALKELQKLISGKD